MMIRIALNTFKRLSKARLLVLGLMIPLTACGELEVALDLVEGLATLAGDIAPQEEELNRAEDTSFLSDEHLSLMESLSEHYPSGDDWLYVEKLTISIGDWEREHLYFGGQDELGRTLPVLAFLSPYNLGTSEDRSRQSYNPTGWNQNQWSVNDSLVWVHNRGHLIAYTLTFNFNDEGAFEEGYAGSEDNPLNLFTQTQHSNQRVMTRFENAVRGAMQDGCNVAYKASPVFRGNELMARGIWLQAVDSCGEVEFSVYIFNHQPGVEFDYLTGENWLAE